MHQTVGFRGREI